MKVLKQIWAWLNKKKTVIATFYWGGCASLIMLWFPDGLPSVPNKVYLTLGIILSAIGLGHKAIKSYLPTKKEEIK